MTRNKPKALYSILYMYKFYNIIIQKAYNFLLKNITIFIKNTNFSHYNEEGFISKT